MTATARKKIAVFSGDNVATSDLTTRLRESFLGAAIGKIHADSLADPQTLNDNTLAFILPGVNSDNSPYNDQLGAEGNTIIRRLTACTALLYDVLYAPPWLETPKARKPGLDFFNGLARGPLPGRAHKEHLIYRFRDCNVTAVSYADGNKKAGIAYGNGPAFYPHDTASDLEIIARYEDSPDRPIAIAARPVGKGLAIFVGVLPYIGYNHEPGLLTPPVIRRLINDLRPHEQARRELWDMIVSKIKQHNAALGRVTLLDPSPLPQQEDPSPS